jgi:hypothetical protein
LDLEGFGEELGAALVATKSDNHKFEQFAKRVHDLDATVSPDDLRKQFDVFLQDQAMKNRCSRRGRPWHPRSRRVSASAGWTRRISAETSSWPCL